MSTDWWPLIGSWDQWRRAQGSNEMSLRPYRYYVAQLARETGCEPAEVTTPMLVDFLAGHDWMPETRKSARNAVRSFYRWLLDSELISSDPARRLPPVRVSPGVPNPVPDEVIAQVLESASERDRRMVSLAAMAGLRCAEISRVHTRDLVRRPDGVWLRVLGKGNRVRVVPLGSELSTELLALAPGWIFPGHTDGHLSAAHVGVVLGRLLPAGWTGHKLRHRFATTAYAANRDLLAVQQLLGHSKPETTMRYTALSTGALRAGVERAASLEP